MCVGGCCKKSEIKVAVKLHLQLSGHYELSGKGNNDLVNVEINRCINALIVDIS